MHIYKNYLISVYDKDFKVICNLKVKDCRIELEQDVLRVYDRSEALVYGVSTRFSTVILVEDSLTK